MNMEIEKETAFTDDNEFISPKIDYAFKQMMNNKIALSSFLSAILKINIDNIKDIQYVDTHTLKEYENDKYIVMDLRLILQNEHEIEIEMQVMNFKHWTDRVLYYNCKMLIEQAKKGDEYGKLIQCISISILNFNIFNQVQYPEYYSSYHIREDKDYRIFNNLLEFHVLELPKIPDEIINNDELFIWAKFINSSEKEEMEMLANQNAGVKEAYKELISLNNDDVRRQIYNSRKKAIMDYNVQQRAAKEEGKIEGKIEGIIEGIIEGKIEIAKNLLKKGLESSFISETTELPLEEIERLKKDI
ncbi:MAG: Rpn family recombination-promoting nuclease/putative transposase [Mobilitalea sp.]